MKKQLLSLTRLKHFRNLCYSLCFLLLGINTSWGQAQTIGSFPHMDGGFEGQTATLAGTAISGTLSTAAWSVSSSTKSTTKLVILNASAARSGSKYFSHTTNDLTIRLQSPSTATESAAPALSTQYTVQYYFKTTTDPATGLNRGGIYNDAVNGNSSITVSTIVGAWSSNVWTKAYSTLTTAAGRTTPYAATGFGALRTAIASSNLYDDFVIYPGAYDALAPSAAPASTVSIASATTFNVGWTASTDTDKTGYMVVRYTADPTGQPLPNVNGIYGVGNTIGTGTVAYLGTGNSFIDTVSDTAVTHYYRIYTVDKAFNYSDPLDLVTVVDNTPPGNPGAVTVGGATATTLSPSWEAASSIDGGGYLVVRYDTIPNDDNDPTQKTTYVPGNTYTNGTGGLTGTVVYVGTGLITTDTGLTTDVTYYYKVYTFDQAKNYSGESSGSGTPTSAEDNTAPNDPGTASISNQTTTTLTTNWLAAPGGVDGGGYMVVRYSGDPSPETGANPVQKATYLVNDTYATGTNPDGITAPKTARVVYIGTDLTCITTGLSPSDYTYYKVYTFDAAKNYSGASFVKGKTSYQFVTPTALAATVPTADGFTANWNLLDDSLTPTAAIYTVNTYTVASTESTFVGWTIPATVAETVSLIADVTTANNTTSALTVEGSGGNTINTSVSGNPGFAARGTSWYSTSIISGTEGVDAVYAEPKANPDRYWQVKVNTVGYVNPTISSHQLSTATGPRDFKLQYSSNGTSGTFTDLVSTITVLSTWNTTAVANVALPVSCHNNPNVVLRWVQTSFKNTTDADMTTPSTGGSSRIDNILLKGFKLTAANTTASTSTTNTSIAVSGLASGSYYYDVVASKNNTTDATSGVVSTYAASSNSNLISVAVTTPQNVANYRSTASGPISSTSIWQYFDATTWQTATAAPTSANNVTIQVGHTITLDANFVFNTGKSLTISGTLDLAGFNVSGVGATVTSNSNSKVILGNNVSLASGISTATVSLNTDTDFDFNGTSVAQHTGGLPGSTLSISNANGSQNYTTTLTGNITVSNPLGVSMNQTIKLNTPGILTVTSTGKFLFGDGNEASGVIAAGTYNSGTYNLTGTGSFVAQSDCTLVITSSKGISGLTDGNIRSSTARTFGSGINFVFSKNDGFNPISMGTSFYNGGDINPTTGIKNMTIDCPNGVYFASTYTGTANTNASGFVTTITYTGGNDITVNGVLNFVSGKLYTGDYVTVATNSVPAVVVNSVGYYPIVSLAITPGNTSALKLNVGASGSITGASSGTGWVVGNLKKATSSGNSPSFNFAIGDATNYFPLALTFSGNTTADGELAIKSYPIALSNLADSGIDNTKKLNRNWSLTNSNLAGFGTYEATFNYASTDNDAGTTASNYVVRRFDNSTWSPLTTLGTPTTTTISATGNTGFGSFAIGESNNTAPVASAQSFCGSATVADLVPSSGTSFKWYSVATGGTALNASTVLTTGTYYVSLTFSGISETSRTAVAVTVNANTNASVVNVSSIAALQSAINDSNCGDIIILADGHYTDTTLNINRSNITVKAATNGGVYLDGVNDININGNYVKFNGFQFTSGDIGGLYLIEVWGSHNTLSQLNFNGYNAKKFIVIQANSQYNTVEYSNIKKLSDTDSTQLGCAIQIHSSYTTPGYHKIRYCSFQNFEGAGGDYGNEPIRIGLSTENSHKSRSIVEYCYFNNTGLGDSETVSIKSQENTVRFCTFTNQQNAHLTFRNGDNNVAYSNFFIDAGGIRVREASNIYCYNNYFQNSGTTDTAVSNRANAVTYLYDTSTYPVVINNVNFVHNTFYNCANIDFGGIGATNNTWANNIFKKDSGNIFMNANGGTTFAGNMYQGTLGITIPSGMANTNPNLTINSDNYYGLTTGSPAIDSSSSSYPTILHIPNIDDDASLLYDVSGQSRPSGAVLKDVGCDEFTTGAITNRPLVVTNVGPAYLGGPATAAPTALAQAFCTSGTVGNLVATGTDIKWYSSEVSTLVLSSDLALEAGTYYATQTLNGAESTRTAVAVTFQAAPNAGSNGTLSLSASPSDATLFAALTGADAGGSWSRPSSGYVGVYTYTVNAISPCTVNATSTVTVTAATLLPTADTTYTLCAGAKISNLLAAATSNGSVGVKVYAAASGGSPIVLSGTTDAVIPTSTTPKAYWLTEPASTSSGESARVRIFAVVNALPATPSALVLTNDNAVSPATSTTAVTALGLYAGTSTPFKLTATAAGTGLTYKWTLPTGVVRTNSTGTTTDSNATSTDAFIYVKFTGTGSATPLVINVQSVNASGCTSLVKASASLTRLLPAAPSALAMNNGVNTTAITTFAKYMGSPTVLRLSATASVTATSYLWELPTGVNRMTALTEGVVTTDLTSTDPFIYVNFAGVTKDNTDTNSAVAVLTKVLRIGVKSVNGVGSSTTVNSGLSSTAKLLTLTAVAPAAPASLAMNNGANTTAITVISKMIGQGATVKLLAPISALASSYAWEIPACVTRVSDLGGLTADNTSTSTDPFIYVKFNGTNPAAGSIYFGVTAVNGVGSSVTVNSGLQSTAKLLKLATVVPAAPASLAMNNGANTTAITVISKMIGQGATVKLLAPTSALANSYAWEIPACVTRVTDLGGSIADNTSTSTDPFIYVKFNGTNPAAGFIYFGVLAVNGVGSSVIVNSGLLSTAKLLKLATVVPAAPATLVLNDVNNGPSTTAVTVLGKYIGTTTKLKLTAGASVLANTYSWTLPDGVNRVDELGEIILSPISQEPFIFVNFLNVPHEDTTISLVLGVKAVNSVGSSLTVNTGANIARTDKLLTVTAGLPVVVATVSGSLSVCNRSEGFSYTITAPVGATSYIITAPAGSVVSSTNGVASATSTSSTNNVLTTSDLTFKVVYNGTAAFSTTDKSLVIRSANAFGPCLTTKALALTKTATCTSTVRLAASTEEFNVIAYPNPSSDVFTLEVQSLGKGKSTTGVQVYDMTGRLIEQRQEESNSVEVGNNYPSGVYIVIVSQGEEMKTLRVIKK